MAPTLLKKASRQFIRISSCESKNALESLPGSEVNDSGNSETQHGWKLRNSGSKRWKPFLGAFKSIRKSARGGIEVSKDSNKLPEVLPKDAQRHVVKEKSCPKRATSSAHTKELLRNLQLNPLAMKSNSTLVIRASPKGARSSLQLLDTARSSELDTPRSSEASGKLSTTEKESTGKKLVDSPSSQQNRETTNRRHNRRNPWTRSSPEGRALSTIPEAGVIQARPTITTVERASAAKIFLETYFNELFYKPDARDLRRQSLESELCNCLRMPPEEKEKIRIRCRN
ncbi:hypothetical protein FSARC_7780 [Fusarium sarcochroum]|uniref:Uncharacterized protein n=1 Tax=Fusarium sarcochroum TaxID=1208366 RepID=A0A8H4TUK1_9HYPO|nr:hypothetical protein FSARC_7780 [Fusarium sarcochroum]